MRRFLCSFPARRNNIIKYKVGQQPSPYYSYRISVAMEERKKERERERERERRKRERKKEKKKERKKEKKEREKERKT